MSRQPIPIDPKKLQALMRLKPTVDDCAAFFECSPNTIERFIKKHFDMSFGAFRDKGMVQTRFHLIRTALQRAEKSDIMLIFSLKNLCGWKDRQDGPEDLPGGIQIRMSYDPNQKGKKDEQGKRRSSEAANGAARAGHDA